MTKDSHTDWRRPRVRIRDEKFALKAIEIVITARLKIKDWYLSC